MSLTIEPHGTIPDRHPTGVVPPCHTGRPVPGGAAMTEPGAGVPCLPWPVAAIAARVRAHPDAVAVKDPGGTATYQQLWSVATAIAARLADLSGTRVAISAERGRAFTAAALGAWLAGRAYVPLDALNPVARLQLMVDDAKPAAVLVSAGTAGIGATLGLSEVEVPDIAPTALSTLDAFPRVEAGPAGDDDPPAYVMYTSGTTGVPKGVVIGHRSLGNLIRYLVDRYGVGPDDRFLHVCNVGFDASIIELWPVLAVGGSVVACEDADRVRPAALARLAEQERCTLAMYPTGLGHAALAAHAVPDVLRLLFVGGERLVLPVPAPTRPRLVNVYGPTEATVSTTMHLVLDGDVGDEPPIGAPVDNARVRLCDPAGRQVPHGEIGELYVGGAPLAHGYLNRPDLTQSRFVHLPDTDGRWYRSGDLARWDGDVLVFHGRTDQEQLKARGVRVEAGEIEAALVADDLISGAAVTVVGVGSAQQVVAVLVPAGQPPSDRTLRANLLTRLPAYLLPDRFVVVDGLPLSANGKLDRARLAAVAQSAVAATEPS